MSALLEGFRDDGCIKGLFADSSDSSDDEDDTKTARSQEDQHSEKLDDSEGMKTAGSQEVQHNDILDDGEGIKTVRSQEDQHSEAEFSYYESECVSTRIKLETNKSRGIAHQVSEAGCWA